MMRNIKSGHAALLRPTYSGSVVALALAVAAIAAPTSFAQGKTAKADTAAVTQTTAPATAQTPNRADAYYHYMLAHEYEEMANTYGRSEYATRAVEEYKMALNDDPNSTFLNNGLAELYYRTGRVKDAILTAEAQIAKDPDNLSAHKLLGNIYLRSLGENEHSEATSDVLKLATSEFEKIVQLEPKNIEDRL